MLVLERRPGASVRISDDITVRVGAVKSRDRVKLEIDAPRGVPITRAELLDQLNPGKAAAHPAMRVLLVEDDPAQARVARLALARSGVLDVVGVSSAEAALSEVERCVDRPFDLFVLDYDLPGMNGLELLRILRTNVTSAFAAIAMLSAGRSETQVRKCLASGANIYLHKGDGPRAMSVALRRLIGLWSIAEGPVQAAA